MLTQVKTRIAGLVWKSNNLTDSLMMTILVSVIQNTIKALKNLIHLKLMFRFKACKAETFQIL